MNHACTHARVCPVARAVPGPVNFAPMGKIFLAFAVHEMFGGVKGVY
jgi:hypothetical protein